MSKQRYRENTTHWIWGRLQWGHDIGFITEDAESELKQIKKDNPDVDFNKLAEEVKTGRLKPKV